LDLVLFFCDPAFVEQPISGTVEEIARLCDTYSVPFASNVATAEVLIQGLRRGDLDWRDIVNPKH
jgi:methylglyoxal synthase